MKLALFLPGAYIWPVHRSFEAFLASLAAPAGDELHILGSALYPATFEAEPPLTGIPARLDKRLLQLHRDLYDAMLRPLGHFAHEECSIADYFWPDLAEASLGQLFEAFLYCFTRRTAADTPVALGLSVIRSVFFSHEQAEPEHWLHTSTKRLAFLREQADEHTHSFTAPPPARVQDLAFVVHSALDRPPLSAGWITGTILRGPDGLCRVQARWAHDSSCTTEEMRVRAAAHNAPEVEAVICRIFGWDVAAQEAAA